MTIEELRALLEAHDLNLVGIWPSHFVVSLRFKKKFGTRYQCGMLQFRNEKAFRASAIDETVNGIVALKTLLENAAMNDQGDVADKGTVMVATKQESVESSAGIKYPAH
jgi:hypothetical protein